MGYRMLNLKSAVLACVAVPIMAVSAGATTLDFDSGVAGYTGTNNLTSYSQDGFSFDVSFTSNGDSSGANLFDTLCGPGANCSSNGDDRDLVPTPQGENGVANNILILQEVGASLDDDSRRGGSITFTLTQGSAFQLTGFSAVDDGRFGIEVGGNSLGSIGLSSDNETGATTFGSPSSTIGIGSSFTVVYSGSGGVDSIQLSAVPLPAGFPLIVAGLGALGFVARKKRKA